MQDEKSNSAFAPIQSSKEIYEDPMQHLWAISYSDLLMVLMSLFVIFFQMEDVAKGGPLHEIFLSLKGTTPISDRREPGSVTSGPRLTSQNLPATLLQDLKETDAIVDTSDHRYLQIHFPKSLYSPGGYKVEGKVQGLLVDLFDKIEPHRESIELTFVGHTDDVPLKTKLRERVESNLVLSSLRAARAAEYAISNGFDPHWVSTEGRAQHRRNTRSLTVVIGTRSVQK